MLQPYQGRHISVNKNQGGNGFTTAFSNIHPPAGKINILIEPNQAVVEDKMADVRKAIENGGFGKGLSVGFVMEGHPWKREYIYCNLLVFVADSFVENEWKIRDRVNQIVLDEVHTAYIQSSFRYKLKKMFRVFEQHYQNISIAKVTATPLLHSKIDLTIENSLQPKMDLNISANPGEAINRLVERYEDGETVLLFTNESGVAINVLNRLGHPEVRLVIGKSFLVTLTSRVKLKVNNNARLIIATTKGFEGWSLLKKNTSVFIFMNNYGKHSIYTGGQIYQAMCRPRKGYKYAELCIRYVNNGYKRKVFKNFDKVMARYMDDPEAIEKKLKPKYEFSTYMDKRVKYWEVEEFFDITSDDQGVFDVKLYNPLVNLYREHGLVTGNLGAYRTYFHARSVTLNPVYDEIKPNIPKIKKPSPEEEMNNIVWNYEQKVIDDEDIPNFFYRNVPDRKELKDNEYNTLYLQYHMFETVNYINVLKTTVGDYPRQLDNLRDLYGSDPSDLFAGWSGINKARKIAKGESVRKLRQSVSDFNKTGIVNCIAAAREIANNNVTVKYVAHRDYNTLTAISIKLVQDIASNLGLIAMEFDIRNAYPRFLWALNGMELPDDFYGADKKNKLKINITLNNLKLIRNGGTYETQQKLNARRALTSIGVSGAPQDYFMEHFFESKYRGDFFNKMSFLEKITIKEAKGIIDKWLGPSHPMADDGLDDYFTARRHDSFILFTTQEISYIDDVMERLKEIKFNGVQNFF